MTTISAVSPAPAGLPTAIVDHRAAASAAGAGATTSTSDDTSMYPPEYFDLQDQRATLEAEIRELEAEQWRKIGSANVSMTLASMFRLQEENEADDAIENGETPTRSAVSSVMATSGRAALRSAGETATLSTQKKEELTSVKAQIAEIEARLNPPKPAVAVV